MQLAALARAPAIVAACAAPSPGGIHDRSRDAVTTMPTRSPRRRCRAATDDASSTTRSSGALPFSPAHSSTEASTTNHTTSRSSRSISRTSSRPRRALAFHAMRLKGSPGTWSRSSRSSSPSPARFAGRPTSEPRRARPPRADVTIAASVAGSTSMPTGFANSSGTS